MAKSEKCIWHRSVVRDSFTKFASLAVQLDRKRKIQFNSFRQGIAFTKKNEKKIAKRINNTVSRLYCIKLMAECVHLSMEDKNQVSASLLFQAILFAAATRIETFNRRNSVVAVWLFMPFLFFHFFFRSHKWSGCARRQIFAMRGQIQERGGIHTFEII